MTAAKRKRRELARDEAQRMDSIATTEDLQKRIRACRACESLFRGRFVDAVAETEPLQVRPLVGGALQAPVMLVGQAPGLREYRSGRLFQGRAGTEVRKVFERQGIAASSFDSMVYQTSVTKCFPGRQRVSQKGQMREQDRAPTRAETANCMPFLSAQLHLVRPKVLVLLGASAIAAYELLRGRRYVGDLRRYVGRAEDWDGVAVVFLPHTSGNSRWLNPSEVENRRLFAEAERLLAAALQGAGVST
jgi:uracil-DNA glycosylase family 4